MSKAWNAAGYIASSRYRLAVCEYLQERGSGLPSRIAADTGLAQPHVSRALSELKEREIVELLVPETQQKGRLYGLTDLGTHAYRKVALDQLGEVVVVEKEDFPIPSLLTRLKSVYGSFLRGVVWCESDQTWVHFHSQELATNYDKESLKTLISTLTSGDTIDASMDGVPAGDSQFVAIGLEDALILRLQPKEDIELLVSIEPTFEDPLTELVATCRNAIQSAPVEGRIN